jgi:phosphate transport system permease protein
MSDLTAPAARQRLARIGSDREAALARVRARYRAERRFRLYGAFAIATAALFLLVLMVDILIKGVPAFWTHSLVLEVPVTAAEIDPQGTRNPETLRAADYFGLAREALTAAMPGIEGRRARRELTEILSTGAGDRLRARVLANPALVGETVTARLLLSDDADLYLKGWATKILTRQDTRGSATPSGTTGEVTVASTADDFAPDLLAGQQELGPQLPSKLVAINGGLVKATKLDASSITGEVLLPLQSADAAAPGTWHVVTYVTPEANRRASDRTIAYLERLKAEGRIERHFNWLFLTSGDSREPELAGILGALVGSALTLAVTLVLCVPIGVLAAIYLEAFAPKNRFTDVIEININNLAAVPSIVFGLLGLAVFLNFFGLPRSAALVGGLVLALLVLPTIIIAARAALRAVPPSITEAALGVGASRQQAIFHHVLPLAMPGILTGTIIGMAHALGETAPLLLIGMVAFIVDVPGGITEAATALPVQIYLWSDLPEAAFQAKTAAAIIVLLVFLFLMNGMAIWLRRKFEKRW